MQYRIQFLDGAANVVRELHADARSATGAATLVADMDWPPHPVSMRVLDADGREVHFATRGEKGKRRSETVRRNPRRIWPLACAYEPRDNKTIT